MAGIIELLVKIQLIDERQHDAVLSRAHGATGGLLVQQVAEMGYATEGTVARAVSIELGLPRVDLGMTPAEEQAVALLDARTCAERFMLPVALRENGELLWLAMADPTDQESITLVRRRTGRRVRPAVAGPSEILRTVRRVYSAPGAGSNRPEAPPPEKLAAIEIADSSGDALEVAGVGDEIRASSALSRIAEQLGVAVPETIPSQAFRHPEEAEILEEELEPVATMEPDRPLPARGFAPLPSTPPRAAARKAAQWSAAAAAGDELDQLLSAAPGPIASGELDDGALETLAALRSSLEKGALVLRAVAELCVEKGIFTRDEMRKPAPPR